MGLYLRGNIWWMEYRTRSVRKQVSTGFKREERKQAKAAFAAFKLGMSTRQPKKAMETILAAMYDGEKPVGIPIGSMWRIYEDWFKGKGKSVANLTWTNMRNLVSRFVDWAAARKISVMSEVSVEIARDYVSTMSGLANKTRRIYCRYLSAVWTAVGQIYPNIHNPWCAAAPVDDGSSIRHEMFTDEEIERIMGAAKAAGVGWYLACRIALYTGLRYGDIATLDWAQVDLARGIISVTPGKTRKSSGIELMIPIAAELRKDLEEVTHREGFVLPEHAVKYMAGTHSSPMNPRFSDILASVGIEGKQYGFHSWRHTANSRMAEAGVPSEIRQMICGWTNAGMARHYDHAKHLAELTAAIAKI